MRSIPLATLIALAAAALAPPPATAEHAHVPVSSKAVVSADPILATNYEGSGIVVWRQRIDDGSTNPTEIGFVHLDQTGSPGAPVVLGPGVFPVAESDDETGVATLAWIAKEEASDSVRYVRIDASGDPGLTQTAYQAPAGSLSRLKSGIDSRSRVTLGWRQTGLSPGVANEIRAVRISSTGSTGPSFAVAETKRPVSGLEMSIDDRRSIVFGWREREIGGLPRVRTALVTPGGVVKPTRTAIEAGRFESVGAPVLSRDRMVVLRRRGTEDGPRRSIVLIDLARNGEVDLRRTVAHGVAGPPLMETRTDQESVIVWKEKRSIRLIGFDISGDPYRSASFPAQTGSSRDVGIDLAPDADALVWKNEGRQIRLLRIYDVRPLETPETWVRRNRPVTDPVVDVDMEASGLVTLAWQEHGRIFVSAEPAPAR